MSVSHSQELGQRPNPASDWLQESQQPIRKVSLLTQLLTMTTTHKFPFQVYVCTQDMLFEIGNFVI